MVRVISKITLNIHGYRSINLFDTIVQLVHVFAHN